MKIIASILLSLAALVGGSAAVAGPYPAPAKTFIHPSDQVLWQQAVGYDRVILPAPGGAAQSAFPPVAQDAYNQSTLGPNVMLWVGGKTPAALDRFPGLLYEATKYPNIKSVYVYDEYCWGPNPTITFPCQYETEVHNVARAVKAAGLKSVIVMMPQVILHPGFSSPDINAFSEIGIDIYPGMLLDENLWGCHRGVNILEDFLMCSIERLRTLGFTGKIGYVYQAFGLAHRSDSQNFADAAAQRIVIDNAKAGKYDIGEIVPWGMYLGVTERAMEPALMPLGGTPYEYLVAP